MPVEIDCPIKLQVEMMKINVLVITILILVLTTSSTFAQRDPTDTGTFFQGGSYDGYAGESFAYRTASSTASSFQGGSYDGYAGESYAYRTASSTASSFQGGSYDGYAAAPNIYRLASSTEAPFTGGSYDGYSTDRYPHRASDDTGALFSGGSYDGYSGEDFAYRRPSSTESPFTGGNYDGAAMYVTAQDISLPVQLSLFTARTTHDGIEIVIETASETNFAGFNIFRSDSINSGYILVASYVNHPELQGQGNDTHGHQYIWKDEHVEEGKLYWYKLMSVDVNGYTEQFGPVSARAMVIPESFALRQNYPNPFNPSTTIVFELPRTQGKLYHVRLEVFDINGKKVRTLVNGELHPGTYHIVWDRFTDTGQRATSGVYFYRLSTDGFIRTRRMVLLK